MCQVSKKTFLKKQTQLLQQIPTHWSNAKEYFSLPSIIKPPKELIQLLDIKTIETIVIHHHRLLQKSEIAYLYPVDEDIFMEGVKKVTYFIIQVLGGGEIYTTTYGEPHMCKTHRPFAIDANARIVWLKLYAQTLKELHFPKEYVESFWNWLESFSLRMVNKGSLNMYTNRLFFDEIKPKLEWN